MKREITILGQQVTLAFNLGAQIAWEESTGQAFDLQHITTRKATIALYMACIMAGDQQTTITMDQLLFDLTFDEMQTLDAAVSELIREWYHIPATAQKEEPDTKGKKHPKRS